MQWTANDGLPLFAQRWEPSGDTVGAICLVHGLGEHSGRYEHWAQRLTANGFAMTAIDLRGHGQSGGNRGDTPTFDHYNDDIAMLLEDSAERYRKKPQFLYGHSLGGMLALFYLVQRRPQLHGAVITSPALHTYASGQKARVAAAKVLGALFPRAAMTNALDHKALSQDPEVAKAYAADPLVHDRISLGMGKGLLATVDYIFAHAAEITTPLLLMHGSKDELTYASGSEALAELLQGDYTLKIWDGLLHELHNETEKDRVFDFLHDWLERNTLAAADVDENLR